MFAPKLKDYDISVLVVLGDKELNDIKRNQIKLLIIEKILKANCSMFFLVNRFKRANKILKESYAEVITMLMKDSDYLIDDYTIDEIVDLVSLDSLIYYGAESPNGVFSKKSIEEFWKRAPDIEDKRELSNKNGLKKIRLKDVFNIKKKGDKK